MKAEWHEFKPERFGNQRLPPERKYVLIQMSGNENKGVAPAVVVGYLRYSAGDKQSPHFITPGCGAYDADGKRVPVRVTHWADCLGKSFNAPLWSSARVEPAVVADDSDDDTEYPEITAFYCARCGDLEAIGKIKIDGYGRAVCPKCYVTD